jgi:hypothetical protein
MVVEKLEKTLSLYEFLETAAQVALKTGFIVDANVSSIENGKYVIKQNREFNHEFGSGGHLLHSGDLYRGSKRILESKYFLAWSTTSDDDMDSDDEKEDYLVLHEEDTLGRAIFEEIKRKISRTSAEVAA